MASTARRPRRPLSRRQGPRRSAAHLHEGNNALREGDLERALREYGAAIDADPNLTATITGGQLTIAAAAGRRFTFAGERALQTYRA